MAVFCLMMPRGTGAFQIKQLDLKFHLKLCTHRDLTFHLKCIGKIHTNMEHPMYT